MLEHLLEEDPDPQIEAASHFNFSGLPRELLNFSSLEGNSTVKSRTGNEFRDIGISIKFRGN